MAANHGFANLEQLIESLGMSPHPEGGFFIETYRSALDLPAHALPDSFKGDRAASTAILFLLPNGSRSHLHRIKSDEIWHFHLGGPMLLVELHPDGTKNETVLGPDILAGQKLQHVVPAGCWFGGYPLEDSEFTLVGCTVSPGFDFADFEMGAREALRQVYPDHAELVNALTLE